MTRSLFSHALCKKHGTSIKPTVTQISLNRAERNKLKADILNQIIKNLKRIVLQSYKKGFGTSVSCKLYHSFAVTDSVNLQILFDYF